MGRTSYCCVEKKKKGTSHELLFTTQRCVKPQHFRLIGTLKALSLLLLQINYFAYMIYEHLTKINIHDKILHDNSYKTNFLILCTKLTQNQLCPLKSIFYFFHR